MPDRCRSCVLPSTAQGLDFDSNGTCQLCREFDATRSRANQRDDIEAVIEEMRADGVGRPFDCLVGVSGGRDSSYLLYLLTKRHGLRCAAAYYRTPFTDDTIDANVVRMTDRLGVPLFRIDLDTEFHRRFARRMLMLLKKKRNPSIINLLCVPCKYLTGEVFRIAREKRIPAIVFGGNSYEEFAFSAAAVKPAEGESIVSARSQKKVFWAIVARGFRLLGSAPSLVPSLPAILKGVRVLNPHTPYLRRKYAEIRRIEYFYHAPYLESECERVIAEELGWELPPNCRSTWRADCSLGDVKNLLFRWKVGATYFDSYLSNMIRDGQITRERALERLETEGAINTARLGEALNILELPPTFLDELVDRSRE